MSIRASLLALAAATAAIIIPTTAAAAAPATPAGTTPGTAAASFVVSRTQFQQMFPHKNAFYTYDTLINAMNTYPTFAHTGTTQDRQLEAAAFLANVSHETSGLRFINEQNTANYPHYCDTSQPYGCPAGQAAYYGRGPLQLSWNFNYQAAGNALNIDLLHQPNLVATNAQISWKTALWYWQTQTGPGTMTPHAAMTNGAGFGQTIRSINGALECNGNNPAEMQDRINLYRQYAQILGATTGNKVTC